MTDSISINGNEYDPKVVSAGVSLFRGAMGQNARGIQPTSGGGLGGADISSDATITRWLGDQYGGDRDVHKVLGYPDLDDDTALERYRARYEYQDIAARIIDAFPKETWKNPPEVVDEGQDSETEFERVANNVINTELCSYLERLDRAQRLGEYGIMVVDYDDGQDLDQPVQESAISSVDDITYYSVFPQEQVEEWELGKESNEFEKEPTDERYNKPVRYYVDFGDIDAQSQDDDFRWVHWSRVVPHAAEGALETDLKGEPALKKVFYRLVDREKVVGASAEMFWSGADEKIIANASEDFALQQYGDDGEREDFKQQLESLLHDMQKYIVSTGMEYEVIGGQEVDPTGVVDTIDSSIASAIGMPKNKLQGNETGERSTTQDRNNWFDNISTRQTNFAGPKMLRPVLERWISFGILPEPVDANFGIDFPSLFELGETDIADNQQKRASMLQASGLAMTLSSEQKLDFLQEGPDGVDMEQETRELPIDENDERVQEQFLGSANESDTSPPQQAQTNAQAVLDIREKTDAMTDTGWNRAEMLAEGGELSESVIQKMAQFKRHQSNTEYENYSDVPESKKSGENPWWGDNGTVAWFGWGGTAGVEWAVEQSEQITENLLAGEFEPGYFGLNFDPVKHPRNPKTGKFVERPYPVPDNISNMPTQQIIADAWAEDPNFAENLEEIAVDNEYLGPETAASIIETAKKSDSSTVYGINAFKRDMYESHDLDMSFGEFQDEIERVKDELMMGTEMAAFSIVNGDV